MAFKNLALGWTPSHPQREDWQSDWGARTVALRAQGSRASLNKNHIYRHGHGCKLTPLTPRLWFTCQVGVIVTWGGGSSGICQIIMVLYGAVPSASACAASRVGEAAEILIELCVPPTVGILKLLLFIWTTSFFIPPEKVLHWYWTELLINSASASVQCPQVFVPSMQLTRQKPALIRASAHVHTVSYY